MKNDHIMVDLETADSSPTSAIVAIGAVVFKGPSTGACFYSAVDLPSSLALGLTLSQKTMQWWSRQAPEASAVFSDPSRIPVDTALRRFGAYVRSLEKPKVWGNGAAFDNAVLANAYNRSGLPLPWDFRNDRCYRTVMAGVREKPNSVGTYHNALDDANTQAQHLMRHRPELVL